MELTIKLGADYSYTYDKQGNPCMFSIDGLDLSELEQRAKDALPPLQIENEKLNAAKAVAESRATKAEAEAERLRKEAKESNDKLMLFLSGGLQEEARIEEIHQFAEWQPNLSIDAGDAYRIGDILYIAKRDHVAKKDNSPTSEKAAQYWRGGNIEQKQPEPVPGFKYPAGTELEYMGVMYFAKIDTNSDPGSAPFDWDLIDNMDD